VRVRVCVRVYVHVHVKLCSVDDVHLRRHSMEILRNSGTLKFCRIKQNFAMTHMGKNFCFCVIEKKPLK
jgi:hypothetical protein